MRFYGERTKAIPPQDRIGVIETSEIDIQKSHYEALCRGDVVRVNIWAIKWSFGTHHIFKQPKPIASLRKYADSPEPSLLACNSMMKPAFIPLDLLDLST